MLRQSKWSGKTIESQRPKKGGGTHAEAELVISKDHRVSKDPRRLVPGLQQMPHTGSSDLLCGSKVLQTWATNRIYKNGAQETGRYTLVSTMQPIQLDALCSEMGYLPGR